MDFLRNSDFSDKYLHSVSVEHYAFLDWYYRSAEYTFFKISFFANDKNWGSSHEKHHLKIVTIFFVSFLIKIYVFRGLNSNNEPSWLERFGKIH